MSDSHVAGGAMTISLFEPPVGFAFEAGFLVTHDLDGKELVDRVAATLCGVEGGEERERRRRLRAEGDRSLHVLCAVDRWTPGPLLQWATVTPIGGRRLHAKLGLLVFRATGRGKTATVVRAYVTSANLTSSGLGSNREVMVWDDLTSSNANHLSRDVAEALIALVNDARSRSNGQRRSLDVAAKWLRSLTTQGGRLAKVGRSERLVHSLARPGFRLGAQLHESPDSLIIVSPAFAASKAVVASTDLDPVIAAARRVELYAPAVTEGVARFSPAAVRHLQSASNELIVMAVPEGDPTVKGEPGGTRRLHAKLIATTQADQSLVAIGSANFTTSAMTGANREAMVLVRCEPSDVEDLLAALSAHRANGPVVDALQPADVVEVPAPPRLDAIFRIDPTAVPGAASWPGQLELDWDVKPTRVRHREQSLLVAEVQRMTLAGDQPWLDVTWPGGRVSTASIQVLEPWEGFWQQGPVWTDDDDSDEQLFRLLFQDLAKASVAGSGAKPGNSALGGTATDRYSIPLAQRLVRVVRARDQLNKYLAPDVVFKALSQYLDSPGSGEGPEALRVAASALSHLVPLPLDERPDDALLVELRLAARKLDAAEGGR